MYPRCLAPPQSFFVASPSHVPSLGLVFFIFKKEVPMVSPKYSVILLFRFLLANHMKILRFS